MGKRKKRRRRWGSPERIDVEGLRAVESQMQKLAATIDIVFDDVVPGWGFLVLAVEFHGGGLSYVGSGPREEMISKVRQHAQRLRDRVPSQGVKTADVSDQDHPHALTENQLQGLLHGVPAVTKLLQAAMPRGWGFAFLLYSRESDQIVYTCDAVRSDMAKALEEFGDRLEAGDDRGPGVVGTAH